MPACGPQLKCNGTRTLLAGVATRRVDITRPADRSVCVTMTSDGGHVGYAREALPISSVRNAPLEPHGAPYRRWRGCESSFSPRPVRTTMAHDHTRESRACKSKLDRSNALQTFLPVRPFRVIEK
jgi:hypothetical protein